MIDQPQPAISRALFSLATGLEVAEGQQMLEAVGRAKMASVLFDEIIIESGLHVVEMSSTYPAMIRQQEAARISPALLEHSRMVERGMKTGVAIRRNKGHVELYVGTNLPRLEDAHYFERDVAFRYVSEYDTGLLDELAKLNADWVDVITIKRDDLEGRDIVNCPLAVLSTDGSDSDPFEILHLDSDEARKRQICYRRTPGRANGRTAPIPHARSRLTSGCSPKISARQFVSDVSLMPSLQSAPPLNRLP